MDRDEILLERRARKKARAKDRIRARRYVTPRKCLGAPDQFDLNPHGMDAREVQRTNRMTPVLRAWENTREYGPTVEFVPTSNARGGHTVVRMQGSEKTRAKWDGTRASVWLSPIGEDSCTGERTDPKSRADRERAWMSYTDLVQHGLVVERD